MRKYISLLLSLAAALSLGSCQQNILIDGPAVITLFFPPVTKTDYSEATVQIYVRVGTGINPSSTPAASGFVPTTAPSIEIEWE